MRDFLRRLLFIKLDMTYGVRLFFLKRCYQEHKKAPEGAFLTDIRGYQ